MKKSKDAKRLVDARKLSLSNQVPPPKRDNQPRTTANIGEMRREVRKKMKPYRGFQ